MEEHRYPGLDGLFVPVADPAVIAGNDDRTRDPRGSPDVDAILALRGGGLSGGIASAVRALEPKVLVYACEIETAAPPPPVGFRCAELDRSTSRLRGRDRREERPPRDVACFGPFSRGRWLCRSRRTAAAVRLLVKRRPRGSRGRRGQFPGRGARARAGRRVVCVVSGRHIDARKLATILTGSLP
jgi:hypothetical protein